MAGCRATELPCHLFNRLFTHPCRGGRRRKMDAAWMERMRRTPASRRMAGPRRARFDPNALTEIVRASPNAAGLFPVRRARWSAQVRVMDTAAPSASVPLATTASPSWARRRRTKFLA